MSLKDANELTPSVHLSAIIKNLSPADVTVDRIIVASPNYMQDLNEVLSSTSKEVIQSYLMWKVVQAYASRIEAAEIKPYTRFINELQGKVCTFRSDVFDELMIVGPRLCSRALENLRWSRRWGASMDFESFLC